MDCLFCKIVQKQISANIVFENDEMLAFRDIQPQAPVHILLIPKIHIVNLDDVSHEHTALLGRMLFQTKQIAQAEALSHNGYRLVTNINQDGGQTVYHLHFHILGGRSMHWPPG